MMSVTASTTATVMTLFVLFTLVIPTVLGEVLFSDECRTLGGLWACSDCDECQTLDGCTDEEAQYRAGYLCHDWPYFNGVGFSYLPVERKHITCARQNHTTCVEWEERKESNAELAVTDCVCKDYITGGDRDYCKNWDCEGIGVAKCRGDDNDCGPTREVGSITFSEDCCGTRSCGDHCTEDVRYEKTMRDEFQNCTCINPAIDETVGNTITTFCQKWECLDWSDTSGYNYLEYETHTCSRRNADYGYCEEWNWHTDDHDSFENTACDCVETMSSNGGDVACRRFECREKGAEKTEPEFLFVLIALWFFPLVFVIFWSFVFAIFPSLKLIKVDQDLLKFVKTGECPRRLAICFAIHTVIGLTAGVVPGGLGVLIFEIGCAVFIVMCSWLIIRSCASFETGTADETPLEDAVPPPNGSTKPSRTVQSITVADVTKVIKDRYNGNNNNGGNNGNSVGNNEYGAVAGNNGSNYGNYGNNGGNNEYGAVVRSSPVEYEVELR